MLQQGNNFPFGPDWPGQRCGAKTRKGTLCQSLAYKRNGRCSLHGGKSTSPETEDGLARLTAARTTHGKYIKEMRAELIELEECFTVHGDLGKNWRDWFK